MSEKQELPRWWKLAAFALTKARDMDYEPAGQAIQRLGEVYGFEVIPQVMLAWIDSTISQCGIDPEGKPVGIAWQREGSEEVTDADSTPPAVVWAGRLVGARLADDEEMYRAVIASIEDDEQWSRNVAALLTTCGAMLRRTA
ncbi:MAG TPA: hypothetical protein VHX38_02385 [Pseudonocardiaceae bacterium]|jgi:hypothetical protein|nr:hypothetical protein [Pseudonocardiaceae bacterium]